MGCPCWLAPCSCIEQFAGNPPQFFPGRAISRGVFQWFLCCLPIEWNSCRSFAPSHPTLLAGCWRATQWSLCSSRASCRRRLLRPMGIHCSHGCGLCGGRVTDVTSVHVDIRFARMMSVLASGRQAQPGDPVQRPASERNATWLILPVVICLSQRLSHACVSTMF